MSTVKIVLNQATDEKFKKAWLKVKDAQITLSLDQLRQFQQSEAFQQLSRLPNRSLDHYDTWDAIGYMFSPSLFSEPNWLEEEARECLI